ncbi:glycosyltransferase N-terminal domain-containing protein [soil metagenome]
MSKFLYIIFLKLYALGFRIAYLFNSKAKAGIDGRKRIFSTIKKQLEGMDSGDSPELVWMHCASLGEFEQGRPVLENLKQSHPKIKILLTFFSASGYDAMKKYEGSHYVFYLPFDGKKNARKFISLINPTLVLWVKYEYWFYYLEELKRRNIPVLLISGIFREGQPFFKWYGGMWRQMLDCFTQFFVQNEQSKQLLSSVGTHKNVLVNGDTRFDRVIDIVETFEPIPLVEKFCGKYEVIVAGSTWEDDEAGLAHYMHANPDIRFVIAPHEIDEESLADVRKEFPGCIFYSELTEKNIERLALGEDIAEEENILHNVLIIDNIGMLSTLYHYATIAFVGGAFGAEGVHNVLEAAVYGKPVIYGPEFEKYVEAVDLVACGGAITVENTLHLEKVLNELFEDKEQIIRRGKIARNFVYAHKGASKKIIQFIQENRLLTN